MSLPPENRARPSRTPLSVRSGRLKPPKAIAEVGADRVLADGAPRSLGEPNLVCSVDHQLLNTELLSP